MQRHLTNMSGSYSSNLDREILSFLLIFVIHSQIKIWESVLNFPLLILKFNDNGPSKKKVREE